MTGTTTVQHPEVAVVNKTAMTRLVELFGRLCPTPKGDTGIFFGFGYSYIFLLLYRNGKGVFGQFVMKR
jgi:hypothetical protein